MSREQRQLQEYKIEMEMEQTAALAGPSRASGDGPNPTSGQPPLQTRIKINEIDKQGDTNDGRNYMGLLITIISRIWVLLTFPFQFSNLVIVKEYERLLLFRLGKLRKGRALGPGTHFVYPFIDTVKLVDLRMVTIKVAEQETLTKDSVTIKVDALVYYKCVDPVACIVNVSDYHWSTQQLAATTLRNVLGTRFLSEILTEREMISRQMQVILDEITEQWGVAVERVEIKDVRLPQSLQRAMAAEAEATREARAKVVAAEGEHKASEALRAASEVISSTPAALQLRYLQTLHSIAAEKNSTIVFPLPIEIFSAFCRQPTLTQPSVTHPGPRMLDEAID